MRVFDRRRRVDFLDPVEPPVHVVPATPAAVPAVSAVPVGSLLSPASYSSIKALMFT